MFGNYNKGTLTGRKANTKIRAILAYVRDNGGATKYECLTGALGYTGSKKNLRGIYSCNFENLINSGLLDYTKKGYKYTITQKGLDALSITRDQYTTSKVFKTIDKTFENLTEYFNENEYPQGTVFQGYASNKTNQSAPITLQLLEERRSQLIKDLFEVENLIQGLK